MPVQFPHLSDSRIEHLGVCVIFPKDETDLDALVPSDKTRCFESKYSLNRSDYFVQVFSNRFPDGDFHLHTNVVSETFFGGDPPKAEDHIDVLRKEIEKFIGYRADTIVMRGRCGVEKNSLPEKGLARSLVGQKTKSPSGETLTLSGANFIISGKPFDILEWESLGSRSKVTGKLYASFDDVELEDDYLVVAQDTIATGFLKFFLEQELQ
jgi:hypothetical protein